MVIDMEATKYIFGKPDYIESIGNVYPVKLKDYDEFIDLSVYLYFNKQHFPDLVQDFSLFELLINGLSEEGIIDVLKRLFQIVLKQDVSFIDNYYEFYFQLENGNKINKDNYDELRKVVMKQNLMFEQKVYKSKLVQEWANKSLKEKVKKGIKIEFEDMITTVSVFTGKHYWDLAEYTIYQLKADFNRITKFKNYDSSVAMKCAGADVPLEHFAEYVDMFKNPYDSAFVDKEKKTGKLESILSGK